MKRQDQIAPGVFKYSTGQIGTRDLPQMLAECAYHKYVISKKQQFMLDNTRSHTSDSIHWRGQLARSYAQLLTAKKHEKH